MEEKELQIIILSTKHRESVLQVRVLINCHQRQIKGCRKHYKIDVLNTRKAKKFTLQWPSASIAAQKKYITSQSSIVDY